MDVSKYPIIYCIYNADGTFLGELKYMVNKYLYGLKCSMCEITHNTFTIQDYDKNPYLLSYPPPFPTR